jgi:hypothetical protein
MQIRPGELTQFAGLFFCPLSAALIGCSDVKLGSEQQSKIRMFIVSNSKQKS